MSLEIPDKKNWGDVGRGRVREKGGNEGTKEAPPFALRVRAYRNGEGVRNEIPQKHTQCDGESQKKKKKKKKTTTLYCWTVASRKQEKKSLKKK